MGTHGKQVLFRRGLDGYAVFRLPALVYHKGVFLAFCEARRGLPDSSVSDIGMKKGVQHESRIKWSDIRVVGHVKNERCANPTPLVDKDTDTIWLLYSQLPANVKEDELVRGNYKQSLLLIKSTDLGETWSDPKDIADETLGQMQPVPSFYAPGPAHGIQMQSGNLVIQGNTFLKTEPPHQSGPLFEGFNNYSNVFLSTDHGETWSPGGLVPYATIDGKPNGKPIETNECSVVEISNGKLCLNSRTLPKNVPRAQSFSNDGGKTFGQPELVYSLPEPNNCGAAGGCEGSVLGFEAPAQVQGNTQPRWVLFSNPANKCSRFDMSVRLSTDGCQTWSRPWKIWKWGSGYSDMTQFASGNDSAHGPGFALLYERGGLCTNTRELMFEQFYLDDVLQGVGLNM